MKGSRFTCVLLLAQTLLACAAFSQWTNTASPSLVIADSANAQTQSKIRPTSDGGAFIVWFDNRTGGYDVYLQRVDANGTELFPHNGILLADRSVSSTVDYDMKVDTNDNAIVTFNDDRTGSNQICVEKVSSAGVGLWNGFSGITLSSGTNSKNNPKVAALSDGSYVVGWSESFSPPSTSLIVLKRLDTNGVVTAFPTPVTETGHAITLSDLQAGDNGSVISLWIRGFSTSFLASKYLYAQKYDSSLAPVWNSGAPIVVYGPTGAPYGSQGGSVQNGYSPVMIPDTQGGIVMGWYENAGPRNAYVQHIFSNGTIKFPANGLSIGGSLNIRLGAGASYNPATDDIYVATAETNTAQTQYRTFVQRVDTTGSLPWGTPGITIIATNSNQPSFVMSQATSNGVSIYGFDARSSTTGVVFAAGVNNDGSSRFGVGTPYLVGSNLTTKSRLDVTTSTHGFHMITWGDGATSTTDIYANRINYDGSLGNQITGKIILGDFVGAVVNRPVTIKVLDSSNALVETDTVLLNADGTFAFTPQTLLNGTYRFVRKASVWISAGAPANIVFNGGSIGTVTLTNGDLNGDNFIDDTDLLGVINNFLSSPPAGGADLNGDGVVDDTDLLIVINHFLSAGT